MDKRRSERLSVKFPVIFKVKGKIEDFPSSSTLDINAAGLCLHTSRKFDIGQQISLSLKVPSEDLNVEVEVIWVSLTARGLKKAYHTGVTLLNRESPEAVKFTVFYKAELERSCHNLK